MKSLMIYTTVACPFCTRAKALLEQRGVEYEEINLARDPVGRAELSRLTGLMTFPQILIDGETLGGYDELSRADREGRLEGLLAV